MLAATIHSLEIALFALFALFLYRIYALSSVSSAHASPNVSLEPSDDLDDSFDNDFIFVDETAPPTPYEQKMESLKQAQVFAGNQLLDVKREFKDLHKEQFEWLREAISLYLIGAIDFIGKQANCETKNRKELIRLVLKSNLNLSTESSISYFNEALRRSPESDNDHMVRAGATAAKLWLANNTVPKSHALRTQLDEWGVFA